MTDANLRQRYDSVVARLVGMAEADPALIGLYVYGSAARGDVWERSDVDVVFVTSDENRPWESYALVDDGIPVMAEVCSRSHFRRIHARALRGSTQHSIFTSGRLVYASDPTLKDLIDEAAVIGKRDRELLRLRHALQLGGALHSAEKALRARHDVVTGQALLFEAITLRAHIELLERGEPACREALSRACALDSRLATLRAQLLEAGDALGLLAIHGRLEAEVHGRAAEFYKPVLDYLQEEPAVRTASQIHRAVGDRIRLEDAHGSAMACELLSECGLIQRTTLPVRITRKSRAEFEEAAYFAEGDAP